MLILSIIVTAIILAIFFIAADHINRDEKYKSAKMEKVATIISSFVAGALALCLFVPVAFLVFGAVYVILSSLI